MHAKALIDSTEDFNFAKGDIPRHEIVTSMQAAFFAKGRTRNKPLSAFLGCAATVEMAERMAAEDRQNLTFPGIFYVATEDKPRMLGLRSNPAIHQKCSTRLVDANPTLHGG